MHNRPKIIHKWCLASMHVTNVVDGFPATELLLSRTVICILATHSREDLESGLEMRA